MELLNNIKSSIYNPAYYGEILNKSFSHSFKYFLSLTALASLVGTIFISFSIVPEMSKFINEISPKILNYYPNGLEITSKNGKVSTNVQEPYFIKMPAEFKSGNQELKNKSISTTPSMTEEMENLLVIDTKSPLTIDLFKNYKTAALLSYDSFAYYDNGAIKIQPLDKTVNGVITKSKVSAAIDKITPYLRILPPIFAPFIFIFYFVGSVLGKLIYLIFGAFVIWLAIKAKKINLGYGKAYQLGLHAITLGVILETTVFWFYPGWEFPFFFTILMVAIVWVNLKPVPAIDNPPPPAPAETPVSGGTSIK